MDRRGQIVLFSECVILFCDAVSGFTCPRGSTWVRSPSLVTSRHMIRIRELACGWILAADQTEGIKLGEKVLCFNEKNKFTLSHVSYNFSGRVTKEI